MPTVVKMRQLETLFSMWIDLKNKISGCYGTDFKMIP